MSKYAQFSGDFRRRAVTAERVAAAMASLAERQLHVGPYSVGPLAGVGATGRLGTAVVRTVDAEAPSFAVTLPAALELDVRLGGRSQVAADIEINLLLTPRPADGLFLYIDAAPVGARDVRVALRGRGFGAAVTGIVGGIAGGLPAALTGELRRQLARQVTNALHGSSSRRSRTIDIAARIDGSIPRRAPSRPHWVDDDTFGRRFVAHAVSRQRVADGFTALAGQPLSIGPLRTGPGGMTTVRGSGAVALPTVRPVEGTDDPSFDITLPLRLDLAVHLAREHRYHCEALVRLRAVARPADDARIDVDIAAITGDDVTLDLRAADRLAATLGRAGRIEAQLTGQLVRIVNDKVAAADRTVDVGAMLRR